MRGNRRTPIRPDLQVELRKLGLVLRSRMQVGSAFEHLWPMLDAIDPSALAEAESVIVREAELYRRPPEKSTFMARLLGKSVGSLEQLSETRQLEKLFLFHRDGNLREAALRKFDGPVSSAFMFIALAWRLNDWVPEVRRAAEECVSRCFPQTPASIVAQAAAVLLIRKSSWRRWGDERRWLDAVLNRRDVASELAALIIERPSGPTARILRGALQTPWMDSFLPQIAGSAVQPATRAVAYETLIAGQASWPNGWRWRWVDKTIGRRRVETVFAHRPLATDISLQDIIAMALRDRSGAVRSVAMSGVIRHRDKLCDVEAIAREFLDDSARGVRERAEFILR